MRALDADLFVGGVHAVLDVFGTPRNLQPRYDIAPTTTVDVVRSGWAAAS